MASSLPTSPFAGIDRLRPDGDQAPSVLHRTQNFYPELKGYLYKRQGSSVGDLSASDLYGCSGISGVHRFVHRGEKVSLYHCPLNTSIARANPTADMTLAEINGGDLFAGGAVEVMRFAYVWVGRGGESFYNTLARGSYVATPVDAWNQTGHQSITVSANTKGVRVTVPAFPSGVRSANVFAARGIHSQLVYVGTIYASAGSLDVKHFIGPVAASNDAFGVIGVSASNGSLRSGAYYVALAWLTDSNVQENASFTGGGTLGTWTTLSARQLITLDSSGGGIDVTHSLASSTNGAKACYVFVGERDALKHPMTCVGIMKSGETLTISEIPKNSCAHADGATFFGGYGNVPTRSQVVISSLIAKPDGGSAYEIFVPRSYAVTRDIGNLALIAPAKTDLVVSGAVDTFTVLPPVFANIGGLSFWANNFDPIYQADAYAMTPLYIASGLTPPPSPRVITVFESCLVAAGFKCGSQVYYSNANTPENWAPGGAGTSLRFMTVGDPFGDACTALGVFSYNTGANNDPRSFLVASKQSACWMKDTLPDPSGAGIGAPTETLSGRVGFQAYLSLTQTPVGLVGVGSDGDVYLIRGSGEPRSIGSAVKPLLEHLAADMSLMRKVTTVFHRNFLKISYPSSATSTYNDAQIWADLRVSDGSPIAWYGPMTGVAIGPQLVKTLESDDGSRIGGRADALGSLLLDDTSTFQDLGSPIVSVAESRKLRFRLGQQLKRFIGALFEAYYDSAFSHSVLVEFFADADYAQRSIALSTGGGVWDSSSWDASLWSDAMFFPIAARPGPQNLVGRLLSWRLTHSDNAQFILAAPELEITPERRKSA
jgi:hypothetical protein